METPEAPADATEGSEEQSPPGDAEGGDDAPAAMDEGAEPEEQAAVCLYLPLLMYRVKWILSNKRPRFRFLISRLTLKAAPTFSQPVSEAPVASAPLVSATSAPAATPSATGSFLAAAESAARLRAMQAFQQLAQAGVAPSMGAFDDADEQVPSTPVLGGLGRVPRCYSRSCNIAFVDTLDVRVLMII
jgi:hypothetical protein